MAERMVLFEAIKGEDKRLAPYQALRFAIQKPIQVHDPLFLHKAVERVQGWRHRIGEWPYIKNTTVTYSDNIATHGIIDIHAGANQERLHGLIAVAFTPVLNPLGNVALHFNFNADFYAPAGE